MIPLLLSTAFGGVATAAEPAFGGDASAAWQVGALLGTWPVPGLHGAPMLRYDAFVVPREGEGPRLGMGLWGTAAVWPLQEADEEGVRFPLNFNQYGVMAVLRPDPNNRVGPAAGVGFSRIDLSDYYGGPQVLAALGFEGGPRFEIGDRGGPLAGNSFIDALIRVHWSTSRSPTADDALHEWWMVQLAVGPGYHTH